MKLLHRIIATATVCLSTLTCAVGCGGGLTVTRVNSAEDKPNNVWVFFTVKDGEEPVGGLSAEDFEIYEDDKLVSTFESQQKILNPEVAAVSYTLLLLDMSGSVTESGGAEPLVDAALKFSERVSKSQKVAVYAFDGAEKIHPIVRFSTAEGQVKSGIESLRSYKADDPSTNLHGAVVKGLETLKEGLDKDKKPLKFGTLVVFTDGTDRASRVSDQEMREAMKQEEYAHYEMYAVGVGAEIEKASLDTIGEDGSELVEDEAKLGEAFDRIAARIEAHMRRFYLLSYCTPSRKGEHRVRIVATADVDSKGKAGTSAEAEWGTGDDFDPEEHEAERKEKAEKRKSGDIKTRSGEVEYTFNADGMGPPPQCDPERKPQFKLEASFEDEDADAREAREAEEAEKKASDTGD